MSVKSYPEQVPYVETTPISNSELVSLACEALSRKLGLAEQRIYRAESTLTRAKSDHQRLKSLATQLGQQVRSPREAKIEQRMTRLEMERNQLTRRMEELNAEQDRLRDAR
jgi:seryl-tRNA synthetase